MWSLQTPNPNVSGFAQASCQAAFLDKKEFYDQILLSEKAGVTLHARVQPMAFISVGDPQSTLTTVSPSTGFHDMKNGIPHVEKKALGEENMAVD